MTLSFLRIVVLLAPAALAACADTSTQDGLAASAAVTSPRTNAAERNAFPSVPQPAASAPAAVYTVEQARQECWMKVEHDRKAPRDLEKRSKLVETCTGERMAAHAAAQ